MSTFDSRELSHDGFPQWDELVEARRMEPFSIKAVGWKHLHGLLNKK